MKNNIDNFIVLTLEDNKKILININQIDCIKESYYYDPDLDFRLICYCKTFEKVKESFQEILEKINQISKDNQNDLLSTMFNMIKQIQELQNGD